jgi:hypothetical protein
MEKNEYQRIYDVENTHWWFLAKRLFVQSVLPHPQGRWRILDIGEVTGAMMLFFSQWIKIQSVEQTSPGFQFPTGSSVIMLAQKL